MSADKFKIGDKVVPRADLIVDNRYGGVCYVDSMEQYKGQMMTIDKIGHRHYRLNEDANDWAWTDEMLDAYYGDIDINREDLMSILD